MQKPATTISAGTLYAVSEPSLRLYSGAGASYPSGGGSVQTGEMHILYSLKNNTYIQIFVLNQSLILRLPP